MEGYKKVNLLKAEQIKLKKKPEESPFPLPQAHPKNSGTTNLISSDVKIYQVFFIRCFLLRNLSNVGEAIQFQVQKDLFPNAMGMTLVSMVTQTTETTLIPFLAASITC